MRSELVKRGSKTARDGFSNEKNVVSKFNNWKNDVDARNWLGIMGYKLTDIEKVEAVQVSGNYKTDVQVRIKIYLERLVVSENVSIKLVSNNNGFNQVDKRWVDKYVELWNIPSDVTTTLKLFTGELPPIVDDVRDKRRMFLDELEIASQERLLSFFRTNHMLIISDLIKGRGKFAADWMLIVVKVGGASKWVLKGTDEVMSILGEGDVVITMHGNLRIGNISMQRKGGDGGRESAKMLQFKTNPMILVDR